MRVHAPDKCLSQHLQRIVDTTERPPPGWRGRVYGYAGGLGARSARSWRRLASAAWASAAAREPRMNPITIPSKSMLGM